MLAASHHLTPKMAVILHADVVGSTALVQLNEVVAHKRIRNVFQQLSKWVSAYGGIPHEIRGDALLAEFSRASDAVSAAIQFQIENVNTNVSIVDEVRPEVRIGISLGEVIIADGTLTGPDVVLAQRLEQLANANGVCISENVQQSVPKRMPFNFEGLGEQALKGFDYAVNAYSVSVEAGTSIPDPHVIPTQDTASGRRKMQMLGVMALLLLAVGGWWWSTLQPTTSDIKMKPTTPERMSFPLPDKPSIAVLPLTNMSDDTSQEYFADGMTEDLITDLSKVSGLFVIARNSSFAYKGKAVNIPRMAEELGVRYVLEGSIRRAGKQVRINAQLIDALSGGHVWAERYDGDLDNVFALQDRITAAIVRELAVTLLASEKQAFTSNDTKVPAAHDAFLVGWTHGQSVSVESLTLAKAAFEKAVALDPDYARAWGALAELYYRASTRGYSAQLQLDMNDVPALLEKALARPTPQAYEAQLWVLHGQGRFTEMATVIERMQKLDPNYPDTYAWRGLLAAFSGNPESAISDLKTSLRLDPNGAQSRGLLGRVYIQLARYQDAVNLLEESLAREPEDPYFKADLAAAYALAGRLDDGRKAAQDIIETRKALGYRVTVVGEFGRNFLAHPDYRDHLREGLLLAGIPERVAAVDLKLLPENQLSGAQLRELKKAGEMTRGKLSAGQWRVDHLADGSAVHYWQGKEFGRSDWSIEGDQLLIRYRAPLKRDPYSCDIYRNPAGSKETLDEYFANCTIGVWSYAGFPLPKDP